MTLQSQLFASDLICLSTNQNIQLIHSLSSNRNWVDHRKWNLMSSSHWPIYNKLYPAFDSSWLDFDHLHWLSPTYCVSHCSLLTILTWCVQLVLFNPWTYSLQLLVWRGRDQFSYKPSSFIFQPLRRGLIQYNNFFCFTFCFLSET